MLVGQYASKITSGRRVAIPVKFRKEIGEKLVVARWYEKCLVLVSDTSWRALLKRLTLKSRIITSPVRDTDRFILGSAFEVETDSQGRIILPEMLAKYAKLEDEIVFLGLDERVEIWDKKLWEERENYISEKASELLEDLAHEEKKT